MDSIKLHEVVSPSTKSRAGLSSDASDHSWSSRRLSVTPWDRLPKPLAQILCESVVLMKAT